MEGRETWGRERGGRDGSNGRRPGEGKGGRNRGRMEGRVTWGREKGEGWVGRETWGRERGEGWVEERSD